jgi:hypothetical protein
LIKLINKIDIDSEVFGFPLEKYPFKKSLEFELSRIMREEEVIWLQRSKEK